MDPHPDYDPHFFDHIRTLTLEEALPLLKHHYSIDPRFQLKEPSRAFLEAYYWEIQCHQE